MYLTESNLLKSLEDLKKYRELDTVEEVSQRIKEEDVLKFYYCESQDEYYVGRRIGTMYYATVSPETFEMTFCMSRYLPWGKHIVAPDTLWKENTYPSEPQEISFSEG